MPVPAGMTIIEGCRARPPGDPGAAAGQPDLAPAASHYRQREQGRAEQPCRGWQWHRLGAEELAVHLDEAVAGESVEGLPLRTRRIASTAEGGDCRILFIGRAEAARAGSAAELANRRGTLTVRYLSANDGLSEAPDASLIAWERADPGSDERALVVLNAHAFQSSTARITTGFAPGTVLVDALWNETTPLTVAGDQSLDITLPPRRGVVLLPLR